MIRLLVCLVMVCSPCLLLAQDEGAGDVNPKVIAVSVAILEVNGDLQLKDGTSLSAADMNDLISRLREQKSLDRYQFFNLASVEDQQASIQLGQDEPVVSGRTVSPIRSAGSRGSFRRPTQSPGSRGGSGAATGSGDAGSSERSADSRRGFGSSAAGGRSGGLAPFVSNSYTMRQTGSHVQVVSRVRDDGKIVAQLSIACSRVKSAPAPESEESEEGQASADFTPPSIDRIQCDTSALLEPGVSTVIVAEGKDGDNGASRAYIIVSAVAK